MGKISKLMKLLSASAVVAGANSVALADCGLCGDHEHEVGACPHFDYRGYGLSKGYTPSNLPKNDFLGKLALEDRKNADAFLKIVPASAPTSTIVSFPTPTGDTASSDNTWSNTEAASQSSNEKPSASDKLNALKFERTRDLEDSATAVSESDVSEMEREEAAIKIQNARRAQLARRERQEREEIERGQALQHLFGEDNMKTLARERDTKELKEMMKESIRKDGGNDPVYDVQTAGGLEILENSLPDRAQIRPRQDAEEVAGFNREKINISDEKKQEILNRNELERDEARAHKRAVNAEIARLNEKAARQRDTRELKDMMRERVAEDLGKSDAVKSKSEVKDLSLRHRGSEEARDVAYDNRANINISDRKKIQIIGDTRVSKADERRKARAARKREEARNRDREELNEMMAASLAQNRENKREALELRAKDAHLQAHHKRSENKLRRELQQQARQAQIDGDYELAKKLQAEEVKAQIQSDEELAKRLQAEYDAEDAQIRAERFAEEQRRLEEEEAHQARVREAMERVQREEEERLFAENRRKLEELERAHQLASETTDGGVADEEVETDRWSLPSGTSWSFATFSFYNRRMTDKWARQLENLSIRKIECIMWLITTSYQQLQNEGKFAPTAQMAEAISDVNSIFPYSGTNSGVMNVYRAFENTDTAEFVRDLERLGTDKLDGVLYYVASRYRQLLEDEEGQKKAASYKFVELARATLEHFDVNWNTEDVKFVPDNKDVREAPRDPVNFKATDKGIVETEAPETTTWDMPYRVYYAYCNEIRHGLRPTRKSMQYHENPELFREDLRKLTIRRLEALIRYLANLDFETLDGSRLESDEVANLTKDVANVEEKEKNPRVLNVFEAFKNMVDHPNDNSISMQPFGKGFMALTPYEKANALGDIAVAYREKLRSGSRPASLAFVKWADAVCKALQLDGFLMGKDNVHPELRFEEFENEAKTPQVSDAANANNNPALVTDDGKEVADSSPWTAPNGILAAFDYSNHNDEANRFQNEVRRLTIRQQEALLKVASSVYVEMLTKMHETPIVLGLQKSAQAVGDRFNMTPLGDRLMNVLRATRCAQDFESELLVIYQHDFKNKDTKAFRLTEKLLLALSSVYMESLDNGKVPADKVFVDLAKAVFEAFGYSAEGEFEGNVSESPAALEDNIEATEIRTNFWQLPMYLPSDIGDGYMYYDDDAWRQNVGMLNIRQLEVLLVEFAKVFKENGFRGRMTSRMNAVSEAFEHLDAPENNQTRVEEFRSAMKKARGKGIFEDENDGQGSVTGDAMNNALEIVQSEYIRKLNTASPVTQEFKSAVMGY